MSRFYQRLLYISLLFFLGMSLCFLPAEFAIPGIGQVAAQSQVLSADQLVEQGLQHYQAGKYLEAIALWEQALPQTTASRDRVIVLTNLGQAYRQVGKFDQAIAQWEKAIQLYQASREAKSQQALAQLLTEQAQAYSDLGQQEPAVDRLSRAIKLAQKNQDFTTEAAAQGGLGNAYWALGTYDKALSAHGKSLTLACQLNNSNYITTSLNNLGNVFASRSDRYRFQATAAGLEGDRKTEVDLVDESKRDIRLALATYQRSAEVSKSIGSLAEARALLNLNRLLEKEESPASLESMPELMCETLNLPVLLSAAPLSSPKALSITDKQAVLDRNRDRILVLLDAEPNSQDKAYGLINLANSLMPKDHKTLTQTPLPARPDRFDPIALLEKALAVSRAVGDGRAESFALGTLGKVYEVRKQYDLAMELTRSAQLKAQEVGAADSLYRWQWQMGRILKVNGAKERAISVYEQAISTLQSIRGDIVVANKDLQFDFRDSVEPVYRQLIGLLLSDSPSQGGNETSPNLKALSETDVRNVSKVLDILELLKLAELQNFFGDDCVQVARDAATVEQSLSDTGTNNESAYGLFDSKTAVIYSIVLDNQSYMILRLPDGRLKKYPILFEAAELGAAAKQGDRLLPIGSEQLQIKIDQLRKLLEKRSTDEYLIEARSIYQALIGPMEGELRAANPHTLVFIHDGVLRKVPTAALHDGKQFLVEKYPIANTPSLSLTTRRPFQRSNLQALILGLTVEKFSFPALPNVGTEATGVQDILGGTKLIDQAFTLTSMQDRLEKTSYPIIHMATHGKFGADAASTFLLAYNGRITINELDRVLRSRRSEQPVELLTLSACQTAAGDNRSALGIAGVAVRAGVKSALATLWFINDEATVPLVKEFYAELLKPGVTKAEALQRAQVKMIANPDFNHPAVWSPFILIGNWL